MTDTAQPGSMEQLVVFYHHHLVDRAREQDAERARLREVNAQLLAALEDALALLDKQREEYNAMPTPLPHKPYSEGPIAAKARAAIALAKAGA